MSVHRQASWGSGLEHHMCPLYMAWAFSQCGAWIPRVSFLRERQAEAVSKLLWPSPEGAEYHILNPSLVLSQAPAQLQGEETNIDYCVSLEHAGHTEEQKGWTKYKVRLT